MKLKLSCIVLRNENPAVLVDSERKWILVVKIVLERAISAILSILLANVCIVFTLMILITFIKLLL